MLTYSGLMVSQKFTNLIRYSMEAIYISVVLGALSYAMLDYVGRLGTRVFSKRYMLTLLVNMLLGFTLVYIFSLKPGVYFYEGIDVARLLAYFFGALGQKLAKLLFDIFDKKVRTRFGINEEKA